MVYFTPTLGLFHILWHDRMGEMEAKGNDFYIYDVTQNGTTISLIDAWDDIKVATRQSEDSQIQLAGVLAATFVLHLMTSYFIINRDVFTKSVFSTG